MAGEGRELIREAPSGGQGAGRPQEIYIPPAWRERRSVKQPSPRAGSPGGSGVVVEGSGRDRGAVLIRTAPPRPAERARPGPSAERDRPRDQTRGSTSARP